MAAGLFKSDFYGRKKAQIKKQRQLSLHSFVSRLRFCTKKSKWPPDCLKVIFRGEKGMDQKMSWQLKCLEFYFSNEH